MTIEKRKNPVVESLEPLIESLKYVGINEYRISKIAPKLAKKDLRIPDWRLPPYIKEDSKKTIDFFFLLDTINFAFIDFDTKEKFKTNYKGKIYCGSFALAACLRRALENKTPLFEKVAGVNYLTLLNRRDMGKILTGNIEIPMLDERLKIFHEAGEVLEKKYNNHFYNLCEEAKFLAFDNGNGIVDRLVADFPSFNDVSRFNGKELKFYKRAQLAVAETYGRLHSTNLFSVSDIDELTVFADYELPRAFRKMKILEYGKDLEQKIKKEMLLEAGSREENEIRAATIYASELMINEINKYGQDKINALHLDACLWFIGKNYAQEKHHLCRTIAY